jgi:hypothetical protein
MPLLLSLALATLFPLGVVPELSQVIAPSELATTERGAFTSDGRFFVIGTRPEGRPDAGGWLVEITRDAAGHYVANNIIASTNEGTQDGTLEGKPAGETCIFGGMKTHGVRIYASCVTGSWHVSLIEIDIAARTVRAGKFTSCNAQPSQQPCEVKPFYANGMAIDSAGRIYVSNMLSHLQIQNDPPVISNEGDRTLIQIQLSEDRSSPTQLLFTHRTWFAQDILTDSPSPNGVQIEGSMLYFAAGPNINRVEIRQDGSAGQARVHYAGAPLTYIDDFAVRDGGLVLAKTMPPAITWVDRAGAELGTRDMDFDSVPSSVSYQDASNNNVFPVGSYIVTSFFGGGLYVAH